MRRSLRFESLESRQVLAGNVMAELADGVLQVTGDREANSLQIYQDGDSLVVAGTSTTVNGGADPVAFPLADIVDLVVKSKQGDDFVAISGNIPGNVFVDTGPDADGLSFEGGLGLSVGGNLDIDTREGNDVIENTCGFVNVGGNLTVNTREGDDLVRLFSTGCGDVDWQVGGDVSIDTAQGDDSVLLASGLLAFFTTYTVDIGGDLEINTGQGNDNVSVVSANLLGFLPPPALLSIGGHMRVDLGQGNDVFSTSLDGDANGTIQIAGNLEVRAGAGDDAVTVSADQGAVFVGGDLLIDGGPGFDGPADSFVLDPLVVVAGDTDVENFEVL